MNTIYYNALIAYYRAEQGRKDNEAYFIETYYVVQGMEELLKGMGFDMASVKTEALNDFRKQ